MKSKICFLFLFLVCQTVSLYACSGIPKGFCYVHAQRVNDVVLKGTMVASGSQSVQLQVLEVLSGIETRSIITVWDGTDFKCTAQFSMKASYMANLGDTMLIILPKITSVVNAWDVIGDYRRPYYLFEEPILFVKSDTVRGLINGSVSYNPPYWSVQKMSYQAFKNYWTTHSNDCVMLMSTQSLQDEKRLQVRMTAKQIDVICRSEEKYQLQVCSSDGRIILESRGSGDASHQIAAQSFSFVSVRIKFENGQIFSRKFVVAD